MNAFDSFKMCFQNENFVQKNFFFFVEQFDC